MRALKWDTLQAAQRLIYESCLLLNAEQWDDYLKLCDSSRFRYRITNYSPEMRKEQCWMDRDYAGLKHLIDLLPKHNSDRSQLTRHAVVYKMGYDEKQGNASTVSAVTSVTLYRTQLDGIHCHFESGRYLDSISLEGPEPKLVSRTVRLDTRQLDIGSHYLF